MLVMLLPAVSTKTTKHTNINIFYLTRHQMFSDASRMLIILCGITQKGR